MYTASYDIVYNYLKKDLGQKLKLNSLILSMKLTTYQEIW